MKCTLGHPECLVELPITSDQMQQAFQVAGHYSIKTPVEKRMLQLGDHDHPVAAYPYVWFPTPEGNTIRLEMGFDEAGKRIVAIFQFKPDTLVRVGMQQKVRVHIAVYLIDERRAGELGVAPELSAIFSMNERYHVEAEKHFLRGLLRMTLGDKHAYHVPVPAVPPPLPEDDPPEPDHRLGEIDNL